jgi:hypothetical protein
MFANAANLVALLTIATSVAPALAAPLAPGRTSSSKARPVHERSLKAVGIAVAGGVASGAAGAIASSLLDRRSESSELMVDTETGVIYINTPDKPEGRSLKALGVAVAGGVASGAAGAAASHFLGSRSEPSGLVVDTDTGVIYMNMPDTPEARSLKAVGIAVAGGIASGAAGAIASNVLGSRSEPSGNIMVDTDTGVIYLDTSDAPEARSLKAVGVAVAGGIASGAAGAIASDLLGKRSEPSGNIMVDTDTGVIYVNTPDAPEARSLKAVGIAVAGGIASGAAGAIASDLLGRRSEHAAPALVIDNKTGAIYLDKPDAVQARSFAAIGKAIAGDAAAGIAESGAAAAVKNFFTRDAGDLFMDEDGTLFVDTGAEKRSLKAVGIAVAGGIASGAAGAIASDLLGKRAIDMLD